MAKNKVKNIHELTDDELAANLRELRQESLNLRLQQTTGQLTNPARIRTLRRECARLETVRTSRKLA